MVATEFSGPFTSSPLATEYQWSRLARAWGLDGVIADDVTKTDLKVTGSGSSTVSVAAGEAFINGFYYGLSGGSLAVNVTSNASGSGPRVDLVVLRLNPAADSVHLYYKVGGTSAPGLVQDPAGVWEFPLARCTIQPGATVVQASAVVDTRWFTGNAPVPGIPGERRPPTPGQILVEGRNIYLGSGTGWDWVGTAGGSGAATGITYENGFAANSAAAKCQIINGYAVWSGNLHKANGSDIPSGTAPQQFGICAAGAQPTDIVRYGIVATEYNSRSVQNSTTNIGLMWARVEVHPDRSMWVTVPDNSLPRFFSLDGFTYPLTTPS